MYTTNTLFDEDIDIDNYPTQSDNGQLFFPIPNNTSSQDVDSQTELDFREKKQNRVVFINKKQEVQTKERELEWWIGKVIEIHEDYFVASMEDLSGKINIVEFEKPDDTESLFIDSIFTYSISILDKPDGRIYKTTLSFSSRRRWLKEYDEKAKQLAERHFPEKLLDL